MDCRRRVAWSVLSLVVCAGLAGPVQGQDRRNQERFLFVCPTVGMWHWDESSIEPASFEDAWQPAWGLRAGYAPLRSFALEAALVRGSNTVQSADPGSGDVDATTVLVSGLVYFRGLGHSRVYPTLSLGLGYSTQSGATVDGAEVGDLDKVIFHLGVGARAEINRTFSLRLVLNDSFYSRDETISESDQVASIVDMVELSLGLEVRFPVGPPKKGDKLRSLR